MSFCFASLLNKRASFFFNMLIGTGTIWAMSLLCYLLMNSHFLVAENIEPFTSKCQDDCDDSQIWPKNTKSHTLSRKLLFNLFNFFLLYFDEAVAQTECWAFSSCFVWRGQASKPSRMFSEAKKIDHDLGLKTQVVRSQKCLLNTFVVSYMVLLFLICPHILNMILF